MSFWEVECRNIPHSLDYWVAQHLILGTHMLLDCWFPISRYLENPLFMLLHVYSSHIFYFHLHRGPQIPGRIDQWLVEYVLKDIGNVRGMKFTTFWNDSWHLESTPSPLIQQSITLTAWPPLPCLNVLICNKCWVLEQLSFIHVAQQDIGEFLHFTLYCFLTLSVDSNRLTVFFVYVHKIEEY